MRPASAERLPSFYLVGAPKCGTTALYSFLGQHPQIFLPETKELLFFGSDLSYPSRMSEQEFLSHFSGRQPEQRAGAAHTAYLQSRSAAKEIKERRPDADIIIMLRNPVEMLYAWHSELVYETIEDIQDFETALDAEADRRLGRRIPRNAHNSYVESLYYTDVAAFSEQVNRYLHVFGRSKVHVILHDDLSADPFATYRTTSEFLGVDASHVPELAVHNPNKAVRSRALQRIYFGTAAPGHRAVRRLVPSRLRQRLLSMNVDSVPRPEMPAHLRRRLVGLFRDDVGRLGDVIGRDLSHWLA